ncbi:MAG TPA: nicotinate-nucleotide adenylyltransferase [Edaphobacter sp.]|jgi:nicotinate-nucleotide adenylyltransferase|nr:nicotinate-nucleotide adenylyltransferase [Edaphobacter sp.]
MRVALFGGTFDPPHRGHIGIAKAAADAFGLDRVLFAPAGRQPLKTEVAPAAFADRLAMVRLVCAEDARFFASEIDAPREDGTPNYTVDTLAALRESMPDAEMFSLIGADSLIGLRHWREPARLLKLAEWIVASRPGFPVGELAALGFTEEQRARIHLLETVHYDVAATDLRRRLREGDDCSEMLLPEVVNYIVAHGVYC